MRIAICQPLVPQYRVPAFDLLGAQPDIELTVYAGGPAGSLDAVNAGAHFKVVSSPIEKHKLGLTYALEQAAQIEVVDKSLYDLVILPWDAHYRSASRAIAMARRMGLPIVAWGHGYSKRRGRPWATALRNRMGKRADGVLLYTRTIADRLIARHNFDRQRVFVAQNALDQRPIQAARAACLAEPDKLRTFQREHGLNPDHTMIFVSRLEPDNHCEVLIHALADVRQQIPDAKLVLVGKGPSRETLEALAAALEQRNHVIFTGAIYDDRELAPWMCSASVFSYPANMGLSLFHAFGYGLAPVASDDLAAQGPEVEALEDGVNALLYRSLDPTDMAARCVMLMTDAPRRSRLAAAGRALVLRKYTLPNMVQGFLDATRLVDGQQRQVVVPKDFSSLTAGATAS